MTPAGEARQERPDRFLFAHSRDVVDDTYSAEGVAAYERWATLCFYSLIREMWSMTAMTEYVDRAPETVSIRSFARCGR